MTHEHPWNVVYGDVWERKKKWLDKMGMVLYRCHDFWDDFPETGIHGTWADRLGFSGKPVNAKKYYEVHEVGDMTLKSSKIIFRK